MRQWVLMKMLAVVAAGVAVGCSSGGSSGGSSTGGSSGQAASTGASASASSTTATGSASSGSTGPTGTSTSGAAGTGGGTGDAGCPSSCPAAACSLHGECCPLSAMPGSKLPLGAACTADCACDSSDCDPRLAICVTPGASSTSSGSGSSGTSDTGCTSSNCQTPNRCSSQGICCAAAHGVAGGLNASCLGDCDCASLACDPTSGLCVAAGSLRAPASACHDIYGVCAQGDACTQWPADATLYGCPPSGGGGAESCCFLAPQGSGFSIPLADAGPVGASCADYGGTCQAGLADDAGCAPEYPAGAQFLCPIDGSAPAYYCCQPLREG